MVVGAMVGTKTQQKFKLIEVFAADIDECHENTDGCGQICSNTFGSYTCSCNIGYRLDTDRHACNGTFFQWYTHIVDTCTCMGIFDV
jgi:hypothetical protein